MYTCLSFFFQRSIDDVENLIKKHEAFEKACSAQEERFAALERLTTVRLTLMCILDFSIVLLFSLLRY